MIASRGIPRWFWLLIAVVHVLGLWALFVVGAGLRWWTAGLAAGLLAAAAGGVAEWAYRKRSKSLSTDDDDPHFTEGQA